jgi:hypothetical protein
MRDVTTARRRDLHSTPSSASSLNTLSPMRTGWLAGHGGDHRHRPSPAPADRHHPRVQHQVLLRAPRAEVSRERPLAILRDSQGIAAEDLAKW